MAVAVIEYEYRGFDPPPDLLGWDILATVQHAAGLAISHAERYLAEIRTELEEAGLSRAGIAKQAGSCGRYSPIWREVWRGEEKEMEQRDDEKHYQQQASAGKTRLYWQRANAKRARAMKPHEARIARLAAAAEKRYPELNGRATKAAELLRRGHVAPQGGARFSVCSQDGSDVYLVQTERRTCTCYDFKHANAPEINGAPMCKHRAACLMYLKLQAPDPARIRKEQKGRIQLSIEFMQDAKGRGASVEAVAQKAFMSVSHFSHVFKRTTGESPKRYAINKRIEQAKELLRDTDLSASEIATILEYESPSFFYRQFKQKTGMTTTAFRERSAGK